MTAIDWDSLWLYGNTLNDTVNAFKCEIFEKTRFLKLAAANEDYAEVSYIANYLAGTCAGISAKVSFELAKRVEHSANTQSHTMFHEVTLLADNLHQLISKMDLELSLVS